MSENTPRFKIKAAVYMLLNDHGKVLVLRRFNTGWGDGKLTLPSGHVDEGETPQQAAVRELKEETGLKVTLSDVKMIHVQFVMDNYIDFYFEAKNWQGEPKIIEPHKCNEMKWMPINEVDNDLLNRSKDAFTAIEKGDIYSETYWSDTP